MNLAAVQSADPLRSFTGHIGTPRTGLIRDTSGTDLPATPQPVSDTVELGVATNTVALPAKWINNVTIPPPATPVATRPVPTTTASVPLPAAPSKATATTQPTWASSSSAAGSGALMSELKDYAKVSSGKSAEAFQEYAKAWGGRVVNGEVELPPLSVYSE